jgi:hypothetical protein
MPPATRHRHTQRYLSTLELMNLSRFWAEEVSLGKYPFIDFDPESRWHQRIYRDPRVDVWLISWLPSQGTQLHDHGGSAGSFTVLSGRLTEAVHVGTRPRGRLRDFRHEAGATVAFGPSYVHDVRNLDDAPAVSVHAYSRPLTSMTYYDVDGGRLVELAHVDTDDPEPEFARVAS